MPAPDGMKDHGIDGLKRAIKAMREACDDAERIASDDRRSELNRATQVMHTFVWAWANASMGIEGAIAHVDRWEVGSNV